MHLRHAANVFLIAGLAIPCGIALSQEAGKDRQGNAPAAVDQQELNRKWAEVSTPGDAHKRLDDLVGTWDVETRVWSNGPDKEPSVSKGTSTNAWVLGGRFLRQELKGELMGMPYEGIGYTGYDNYNKKYVGFWIDNSSTQMFTMSGTVDKSGKVFTFYGSMDEWMTGENGRTAKYVTRILGKDKQVFEIHDLSRDEPNTKMIEMTYTRKK